MKLLCTRRALAHHRTKANLLKEFRKFDRILWATKWMWKYFNCRLQLMLIHSDLPKLWKVKHQTIIHFCCYFEYNWLAQHKSQWNDILYPLRNAGDQTKNLNIWSNTFVCKWEVEGQCKNYKVNKYTEEMFKRPSVCRVHSIVILSKSVHL